MMMSNAFYNTGGGSNNNLDSNKTNQPGQVQQSNPNVPGLNQTQSNSIQAPGLNGSNGPNNQFQNLNTNFQNQLSNYAALAAAAAVAGVNLNQTNTRGNITPPNSNVSNSNSNNPGGNGPSGTLNLPPNLLSQLNAANSNLANSSQSPNRSNQANPFLFRNNSTTTQQQQQQQQQLTNMLQQQKKLVGQQNLLLNNPSNSLLNANLLNSTISRPQQAQQLQNNSLLPDSTFPALDPSDFPVLHRSSHSPFSAQQQQQAQLQQLQQQLRTNSFQNAPTSAPILNSASAQNLILQLTNSVSSSSTNLANNPNATNMLMMMNNSNSSQQQEFQIQQEDFPALPRPQSVQNKSDSQTNLSSSSDPNLKSSNSNLADSNLSSPNSGLSSSNQLNSNSSNNKTINPNSNQNSNNNNQSVKKGIIISPDGRIKNVPPNMLLDQFGIVGLLAYLRSADREKDIFTLALGTDLTALGLNLNSNENLYHSFLSPFSDIPCRLQDIDFPVPTEYIINFQIKDKLAPIDISRYHEDTLFYLFYMNGGDLIQLQAAAALFDHDWRYHTEKRVWLTKVPGLEPHQKDGSFERGIYTLFDVAQWRKVQMEMSIEYSKLAEKPQLPPQFLLQQQQAQQQTTPNQVTASMLPAVLQQQLQQQAFSSTMNPNQQSNITSIAANTNSTRSY